MNRVRPLSPLEKGHLKNHVDMLQGCWTALAVLEYPGSLTQLDARMNVFKRKVQVGVAELIRKHPMLGMVIVDAATDPWFAKLATVDIEKLVHVPTDLGDSDYFLYTGTNTIFDFDDHTIPPWSVHVYGEVDEKPRFGVTITIPLVLGDGQSVKNLLRDLLESLPDNDDADFRAIVPSSDQPLQPAYEDRPDNSCQLTLFDRLKELVTGPKHYGRPENTANFWSGFDTGLNFDGIEKLSYYQRSCIMEDWDTVVNAARNMHGVTVNAALHAAVLKCIASYPDAIGRDIMYRSPVDLRSKSNSDEVGNISGVFSRVWTASAEDVDLDFWSFAAKIQKESDAVGLSEAAKSLYIPTFNLGKYPEEYNKRWEKERDHALKNAQVTYVTVADFGELEVKKSGNWPVNRVHISQGAALFNKVFTVAMVSMRGTATISVGWQKNTLKRMDFFIYHESIGRMLRSNACE